MTGFWWVHTSGQRNQETVKFLSGPCTAEWAIDCFLYSPPSFFLNTAINFLSLPYQFLFSAFSPPSSLCCKRGCTKLWWNTSDNGSLGGEAELDRCQALCRQADQKIKTAQVHFLCNVCMSRKVQTVTIHNRVIQLLSQTRFFDWLLTSRVFHCWALLDFPCWSLRKEKKIVTMYVNLKMTPEKKIKGSMSTTELVCTAS